MNSNSATRLFTGPMAAGVSAAVAVAFRTLDAGPGPAKRALPAIAPRPADSAEADGSRDGWVQRAVGELDAQKENAPNTAQRSERRWETKAFRRTALICRR